MFELSSEFFTASSRSFESDIFQTMSSVETLGDLGPSNQAV